RRFVWRFRWIQPSFHARGACSCCAIRPRIAPLTVFLATKSVTISATFLIDNLCHSAYDSRNSGFGLTLLLSAGNLLANPHSGSISLDSNLGTVRYSLVCRNVWAIFL